MRTTPLPDLLGRIAGEYRARQSIFGVPQAAFLEAFALEASSPGLRVMGSEASLPVGPAAGPHSQVAPCLVAAYLCGARFFELKTVQDNDALDVAKPCIWALDEGHNVEWSTELSLADAREEYLRSWIAIGALAALLSPKPRSFVFNISVGYTLEGIRGPKVDAFIELMRRPAGTPFWDGAMRDLERFADSPALSAAFGPGARERLRALAADFPASPVGSVTLSTMHGCPPAEIERIGAYLLGEKGLDTFVKLNPTLLGYDRARAILDATGWKKIEIARESFERDLQFRDALSLIGSLSAKAAAAGRRFGVKLSNTLANRNAGAFLPGGERYMSGRALFPLTVRLAADLAAALPGFDQRFSYCGGAWALNAAELVSAGLGPLTVATDLLKPGGYARLTQTARAAAGALAGSPDRPDAAALYRLAESALSRREYSFGWKRGEASIGRALPAFDCFAAPCVEACPVRQKVPAYIREGGAGEARRASETIAADNPLPFVTGALCDHACQDACCRNDYEGPVAIRAAKLACVRAADPIAGRPAPGAASFPGKVAVIGAGPAGLACARELALAGVMVTVFESSDSPGGVPANVIPRFRIPREDIARDVDRVRSLGVEIRFRSTVRDLGALEREGYTAFFAAVGAPVPRKLELEGAGPRVVDALSFLESPRSFAGARRVVVAGGGNTAMDAVRAATRLAGVESVRIAYRRTVAEMPADREELENALAEARTLAGGSGGPGPVLLELRLPERALPAEPSASPRLVLRRMRLGEPDASGRMRPVPSGETEEIDCDLLVAAVGERPDAALLAELGAALGENGLPLIDPETQESSRPGLFVGGDAARGPASIIAAAADGRRAAFAILRRAGIVPRLPDYAPPPPSAEKLAARGRLCASLPPEDPRFLAREAERCLQCDSACLRCVEVCPNRANAAVPVDAGPGGSFAQSSQILHVDRLCNECGNCGLFCPYEGEPYRGKPTLFDAPADLVASRNAGFSFIGARGVARALLRAEPGGPAVELELAAPRGGPAAAESRMAALALAVLRDHDYLIGGAR